MCDRWAAAPEDIRRANFLTGDDHSTGHSNTNDTTNDDHDPDGHLCVVCMDNERSCLYVPCNHLAVCAECDADIMAACLPCPMCNTAIDREQSVSGGVLVI